MVVGGESAEGRGKRGKLGGGGWEEGICRARTYCVDVSHLERSIASQVQSMQPIQISNQAGQVAAGGQGQAGGGPCGGLQPQQGGCWGCTAPLVGLHHQLIPHCRPATTQGEYKPASYTSTVNECHPDA